MRSLVVAIATLALCARAQIPNIGFCPEYFPMRDFDMDRFSGIWYEAERYVQFSDLASRCVKSNYTRGSDGKFHVLNEYTSRITGVKRILEGEIKKAASKADEGKLHVKYSLTFIPLETQYNVLETDYKNYAVLWSCSGIGPVHTQNAWIMTRQRLPPGEIIQKAYGVLDRHRISRLFFTKVPQEDCAYLDSPPEQQVVKNPHDEYDPVAADAEEGQADEPQKPKPLHGKNAAPVEKTHVVPDVPEPVHAKKSEVPEKIKSVEKVKSAPVKQAAVKQPVHHAHSAAVPEVKSVPELLKKVASQTNESPVIVKEAVAEEIVPAVASDLKSSAPIVAEEQVVVENNPPAVETVEGEVEIVKP